VWQLRALSDNYIYVLVDETQKHVAVVDPSEAAPVLEFLRKKNLQLEAIWNTHHHHDHVGGNLELKETYSGCRIFCSSYDRSRVPGSSDSLNEGDTVNLAATEFKIMNVPGHTLGAIAFYCAAEKMLFTGDTLFTMGCGRLFEGSFEQMWSSLARLKELPDETAMFCGHEYTLQNTAFALSVDEKAPGLAQLRERLSEKLQQTKNALASARPTVPNSLGDEKALNPFLNAKNLAEFSHLRRLKDQFRLET